MCSQDLFVEAGHGPTLIDNNILLSDVSLRFATEGVAMVHNLICGAFTAVGGGTDAIVDGLLRQRYTPYHIPHRTEVMGFMTILHGDDRATASLAQRTGTTGRWGQLCSAVIRPMRSGSIGSIWIRMSRI